MINFIVYEDEIIFLKRYENTISKLMIPTNLNYQIIKFHYFDDNTYQELAKLDGTNIYILGVDVPGKTGIDVAKEIRSLGDWRSPIIMVTEKEEFHNAEGTGKILMLDFISKKRNVEKKLQETLVVALEIISQQKVFSFFVRGEMFRIPYQDILYIEKNLNDSSSTIVTKKSSYQIRKTIHKLEEIFADDSNFFKTHRSYIVNIKNIRHIDFDKGIISFEQNKSALLSRSNKKTLREKLYNEEKRYYHV